MMIRDNAVIWTRYWDGVNSRWSFQDWTAEECRETGHRHGADGIQYYSCLCWDRHGCDDPKIYGNTRKAAKVYADGYKQGRREWFEQVGSFPSSGAACFDSAIAEEVAIDRRCAELR